MNILICPSCNKNKFDADDIQQYSISRKEEETKICNPCGTKEAFEDMR